MNQQQWVELHKTLTSRMHEITARKNADYADKGDAFSNFKLVEEFGVCSAEQGMYARMTDKMSRLASFIKNGELQVKDESVEDTLLDLANYSLLMIGLMRSKFAKDLEDWNGRYDSMKSWDIIKCAIKDRTPVDKKVADDTPHGTIKGTGDQSPITI